MTENRIPNPESPTPIHVVAAILRDVRGRILLSRRTEGRDLAGLWEFPGGKVEAGESAEQALRRELDEELGIGIGVSAPLIAVPHAYPHKRILLDVHEVASFSGRPRGRESQALAWVEPARLSSYPMPAADRPVLAALSQPDRYLITPDPGPDPAAFFDALARALQAGIRRVQLRVRASSASSLHALARAAAELARAAGADLLLGSGHPEAARIAIELGLGLHLNSVDLHASEPRPAVELLAASCHDARDLARAEAIGCRFAVLGPVAATQSHPGAMPLGWSRFAELRAEVALPIYALGGMHPGDHADARAHGAQGIAAIRGLWPEPVPPEPTRR